MYIDPSKLITHIAEELMHLTELRSYLIAYSGGVDSHVLLHIVAALREQYPEINVRAMHVHHGLHENADAWALHCERVCHTLKIPFLCEKIIPLPSGESVEAAARQERYRVLAKHLKEEECLLTAHNQDDQAETLLLQLLRGAGPRGLSAMPRQKPFVHSVHLRPLLNKTREDIVAYAKANALQWIDDDSNDNQRFDRNYLRHSIMPLLKKRWLNAVGNISRSAMHCAQATEVLSEMAEEDLLTLQGTRINTLSISRLLTLSDARRVNVLRYWFLQAGERVPSTQQLQQFENDILHCDWDATPIFSLEKNELRRYRDDIYLVNMLPIDLSLEIPWDCHSALKLPGNLGELHPHEFSRFTQLTIRFRRGGECIKPAGSAHTQSLKKLFQQWGVPPWERDRVPLVFAGDKLVAVVGYCKC